MNITSASLDAYKRTKNLNKRAVKQHSFVILIMGLFFIILLATLALGARVYASVSSHYQAGNETRVQTGMIANALHANDSRNAVSIVDGPEGAALVIAEHLDSGTYETRIYQHQNDVCMEYAIAGRPYNPQSAAVLFSSTVFEVELSGGLVKVTTDSGEVSVSLRSEQGGAS